MTSITVLSQLAIGWTKTYCWYLGCLTTIDIAHHAPHHQRNCEWEGDVVAVVAPLGGVAQVVGHGVKVVGVHGEEGQEKTGKCRWKKKEKSNNSERNAHHGWHADEGERLKDNLSQCGVTSDCDKEH